MSTIDFDGGRSATAPSPQNLKIAIIGLGYVGLPLAVEFGKQVNTVGFDIDGRRVAELKTGHDRTREADPAEIASQVLSTQYDRKLVTVCH